MFEALRSIGAGAGMTQPRAAAVVAKKRLLRTAGGRRWSETEPWPVITMAREHRLRGGRWNGLASLAAGYAERTLADRRRRCRRGRTTFRSWDPARLRLIRRRLLVWLPELPSAKSRDGWSTADRSDAGGRPMTDPPTNTQHRAETDHCSIRNPRVLLRNPELRTRGARVIALRQGAAAHSPSRWGAAPAVLFGLGRAHTAPSIWMR